MNSLDFSTVVWPMVATAAPAADVPTAQTTFVLTDGLIKFIFLSGIGIIGVAWVAIPALFAWRNELPLLSRLAANSQVVVLITVTYIILIIATLGLLGKLEGNQLSTLIAAIAGYILGNTTAAGRERRRSTAAAEDDDVHEERTKKSDKPS